MKSRIVIATFFLALLTFGGARAQDGEGATAPYFQSSAFNAPMLEGWQNQSSGDIAQFHLARAAATIRTTTVKASDPVEAAEADLAALTGIRASQPVYSDKVNLADGTWNALVYDLDAATTASVMARIAGERIAVISFVERDPAARTALLTVARADDSPGEASREIGLALEAIGGVSLAALERAEDASLPSGEWALYAGEGVQAMGLVFGNDSYVALRAGELGDLAVLADAYNRTLLGFFITPDNSLYLALGLAAVFVILGALVGSLYWRERNMRKELALLEALRQPPSVAPSSQAEA